MDVKIEAKKCRLERQSKPLYREGEQLTVRKAERKFRVGEEILKQEEIEF